MCIAHKPVNLGFTSEVHHAGTHMCLIYNDEKERRKIISKYLESGLLGGEKVTYFADTSTPADVIAFLSSMEVEIPNEKINDIQLTAAEKTYCPDGKFIPEQMLDTLKEYYMQSREEGYDSCRVSGDMSWALKNIPGSERLMEYEALVNLVLETHPVTAVCQYDAKRFSGDTILRCLEVHPYMIIRGQVVHNPFFIKPKDFIERYINKR